MEERLVGNQIVRKLHEVAEAFAEMGMTSEFATSHRNVPYVKVWAGGCKYHVAFMGKHQFFRVFDTEHNNSRTDFQLKDEKQLYVFLRTKDFGGREEGTFVTNEPPFTLVERS